MAVCNSVPDEPNEPRLTDEDDGGPRGAPQAAGLPPASAGSMGDTVTPHALITGPKDYQYLTAGIDALDLGIYVNWYEGMYDLRCQIEELRNRSIHGEESIWRHEAIGVATVRPSSKRNYRWHIQTHDLNLWIADTTASDSFPTVYASPSAESLWTNGVTETVNGITQIITELNGQIEKVLVSRVDLACDFAIKDGLTLDFLRKHRVCRSPKCHHHENDDALETFYIGDRKAPIQARIYNKVRQMISNPRASFMLAFWGGPAAAWRTEFQVRRSALREMNIDSVESLCAQVGGLWSYLTGEWLSFRLRDNQNTKRRTVHPWWEAIQNCADEFGPNYTVCRIKDKVPELDPSWYISHMGGCLISFASRLGLQTIEEALAKFNDKAREHWAARCWEDTYTRKRIELGMVDEGGDDDDLPI